MGLGLVRVPNSTDNYKVVMTGCSTVRLIICSWSTKIGQIHVFISPAGTKLESQIVHQPGHKRRGHDHCDIDNPSMTMAIKIRT